MNIGNDLEIMFNNMAEVEFLRKHLRMCDTVLEWGSGGSTLEIAKHVKQLYSIEHDQKWYDKVSKLLPDNASMFHVQRNKEEASGHDGTFDDYKDYILYPRFFVTYPFGVQKLPSTVNYDVIFIDGRARVECAKEAIKILKPGGIILIHDYRNPTKQYRRYEYEVVEEFLDVIDGEYALWAFKPKQQ